MKFGISFAAWCSVTATATQAFVVPRRSDPIAASTRIFAASSKISATKIPLVPTRGGSNVQSNTQLSAAAAVVNVAAKVKDGPPTLTESALSASLLVFFDIAFRRLFQVLSISFPSSLGGCCALIASMLVLPMGSKLFTILSPGAALLAKWLPVFFVPSLITLPLAGSVGTTTEIAKILSIIIVGFYFTLLTTAGSVVGVRKLFSSEPEAGTSDNADDDLVAVPTPTKAAAQPFSKSLVYILRAIAAASGVGSIVAQMSSGPLVSLFFLSITLHNFCFGARLPKSFSKIVHPLVTCTSITWAVMALFAISTGSTFTALLKFYKAGTLNPLSCGAGDVLLFLLGPAVVSLAISMYDRRQLMKDNWKEVVTGVTVSSVGGLFGTAAAVRALQLANPYLRLSLLSRNITSPLAIAIGGILGANVSLAISMVVVTGLFGANFGAGILSAFGIQDPVARGLGIGAAAHGLGTAAFVNEKDAFPFAAISMALTATACTCLVSVPSIKKAVIQLALGGVL